MKLQYALLCDYAFLSVDRKVNIIGVFETISAQKFPVSHPKFVIVGSITPSKKEFKMSLNIVDKGTWWAHSSAAEHHYLANFDKMLGA